MYVTQESFIGKTGPIDPTRTLPLFPKKEDKTYPNRWMEERNLRTLHRKVNSNSIFNGRSTRFQTVRDQLMGDPGH